MKNRFFYLACNGYDEILEFIIDEKDNVIYLEHYIHSFYANQRPIGTYFRRMFKMIWCAISGKEYTFFEIVIDQKKLEEFKKFIMES
jgi:hypothetical protein